MVLCVKIDKSRSTTKYVCTERRKQRILKWFILDCVNSNQRLTSMLFDVIGFLPDFMGPTLGHSATSSKESDDPQENIIEVKFNLHGSSVVILLLTVRRPFLLTLRNSISSSSSYSDNRPNSLLIFFLDLTRLGKSGCNFL